MASELKVGDVVSLNGSWVPMTIDKAPYWERYSHPDRIELTVHCVWFDGNNQLHESAFLVETLFLIDPREKWPKDK